MRKRTVTVRLPTVTAVVTALLLAAASGCTSDTGRAPAVGSGRIFMDTSGPPEVVATGAAAIARDRPLAAPLAPSMVLRPEVGAARATANEGGAFTLGSPLATEGSAPMLIRNGQASVEVMRLNDAMTKVRQTAGQLGGFVANMSVVSGREERRSAQLELRVPSAQFDAAVSALGAVGKVESMSASVQDAGEEYVDLGARATNARRMEARLAEMLAQRTGKLSEALTVEQELRRVREEIERYDARLKWLERKAAMSSIQITLHEPVSVLDQPGPGPIAEAFAQAWRRAVGVLAWGIASLGLLVPLGLVVGVMLMLARRLLRPGTPPGVSGA